LSDEWPDKLVVGSEEMKSRDEVLCALKKARRAGRG
jgi:hypothetical protein